MNGKYFLDTNIIVYLFDSSEPEKQAVSKRLVYEAIRNNIGCVSFQVVQEFMNVAVRKFSIPLSHNDCKDFVDEFLWPLCECLPSLGFYKESLDIAERWQYSIYDSMIINAAITTNCSRLLSEDLQDQQKIQSITIKNPFLHMD
jgi:predicted nucleic acid-binding protein